MTTTWKSSRSAFGTCSIPGCRSRVLPLHGQFALEEALVVLVQLLAGDEVHHLPDDLVRGLGRQGAAAIPVVLQGLERQRPDLRLVLLADVALGVAEEVVGGPDVAPDDLRIAGDVDQRRHQGRDAGFLQCTCDGGIVLRDGLPGIELVRQLDHVNLPV
ncbi:MAG: hypothetical protein U5R48_07185 [Gammaproteobacteria bacterium]|nr:hypothetical protein [Gammaproteobacteria bacterium]